MTSSQTPLIHLKLQHRAQQYLIVCRARAVPLVQVPGVTALAVFYASSLQVLLDLQQ
jgi:hypothetical protein